MVNTISAPLLSRVKSWQLVSLGLTGWCTLYSAAILTFGPGSFLIGHVQGGCFAATMTLAGVEAKRHRKNLPAPADPLEWTGAVSTMQLNQAIVQSLAKLEFRVEPPRPGDAEMGFGVRSINSGRTVVFETARWKEPVVDANRVLTTDEHRQQASATLAVIVSVGKVDKEARKLAKSRPVEFIGDRQIKELISAGKTDSKPA